MHERRVRSQSMSDTSATLRELRRTRTKHRLGSTDWYDVAYRVYLFAFGGLTAVVLASDAVTGLVDDNVTTAQLLQKGPSVLGIGVMLALAVGLRSGADGGPVSIETADTRHLLLAPIPRRLVLFKPIWQRFRSVMFGFALVCAVIGQLVATELEGSRIAWAASAGAYGALVGAVFVGSAVIAHALRCPRWLASLIGVVALAWQATVAWNTWHDNTNVTSVAPGNAIGRIALWGISQDPMNLIAVVAVVALIGVSLAAGEWLRLEPLARRGDLVSQLRFAATTQDLRTVVLLRRQLRNESLRNTPWFRFRQTDRPAPSQQASSGAHGRSVNPGRHQPAAVWRRGIVSLRRLPASRIVRILLLAVAAGAFASFTVTSSALFALLLLGTIFLLGLESIEALSQEVDRADRTEGIPIDRGWIFVNHLVAPAILLVITGIIAATTASILDPDHAVAAFCLAIPVLWGGALGPIVATVNDAPSTQTANELTLLGGTRNAEASFVPPEFAGFTTVAATMLPVIVSLAGVLPVIAMRVDPTAATAVRSTLGVAVAIAFAVMWVRRRDVWGVKIREFFAEGRTAQAAGKR
jgi:hypothetical protein